MKWRTAPLSDGLSLCQGVGVRAAYVNDTMQTIISGDRMWTLDITSGTWGAPNHLETAWISAPERDELRVDRHRSSRTVWASAPAVDDCK